VHGIDVRKKPDKKKRIRRKICTRSSKKSQSPFFRFHHEKNEPSLLVASVIAYFGLASQHLQQWR
jgi:hypothetical protein